MRRIRKDVRVRALETFETLGGVCFREGEEATLDEDLADYLIDQGRCEEIDA